MKNRKPAILLALTVVFQLVLGGVSFASETAAKEEDPIAAVAVEANGSEMPEEGQTVAMSGEDDGAFLKAFPGEKDPDAEWGQPGKHVYVYFDDNRKFGHVELTGDVTVYIEERMVVSISMGLAGNGHALKKEGAGELRITGKNAMPADDNEDGETGEPAVSVSTLVVNGGLVRATGGRGGPGGDGYGLSDGGSGGDGGTGICADGILLVYGEITAAGGNGGLGGEAQDEGNDGAGGDPGCAFEAGSILLPEECGVSENDGQPYVLSGECADKLNGIPGTGFDIQKARGASEYAEIWGDPEGTTEIVFTDDLDLGSAELAADVTITVAEGKKVRT